MTIEPTPAATGPRAEAGAALGARIMRRLDELAQFSSEPGALTRLYLTPEHKAAAATVAGWMREAGMQVEVDAASPLSDAHVLPVPVPSQGRNTPGALEHLAGTLEVRVARRGREVWRGTSYLAGLEHGGLARAEAELARRGGRPEPGGPSGAQRPRPAREEAARL